jgi:hypothetical protein
MMALGRALMREWGASVQCRGVGEGTEGCWCKLRGPGLMIVETERSPDVRTVMGGPPCRERERGRAGRAGSEGAWRTWLSTRSRPAEGLERENLPRRPAPMPIPYMAL